MDYRLISLGLYRLLLGLKTGILLTALPLLLAQLSGNGAAYGLGLSAPIALALLLFPIIGHYSDRVGQRKFVLACELASAALYFSIPYLPAPIVAVALLASGTLLMRITYQITLAGISTTKRTGAALGIVKTLTDTSGILGTIVGAALPVLGSGQLFTVLAATSLSSVTLSFFIPDSASAFKGGFRKGLPTMLSMPLLAALLWYGSGMLVQAWWDPLGLGLADETSILLLALVCTALLLGANISAGILLDKNPRLIAQACMLIDAFLLIIAPVNGNYLITALARLARIIPLGAQGLLVQKTALDRKAGFGLALGTAGSLILVSETLFPLLGSAVANFAGYTGVFWLAALLSGAAFVILKYY